MKSVPFQSKPHSAGWMPQFTGPSNYFKSNYKQSIKIQRGGISKEEVAALPKGITVIEKH